MPEVDFKIDPETNDLVIQHGDIVLISGIELVAQRLRIKHGVIRGEYQFDTTKGTPLFEEFLRADTDTRQIRATIQRQVLSTPGVTELAELDTSVTEGRLLVVRYRALTEFGFLEVELESDGQDGPWMTVHFGTNTPIMS